MKSSFRAYLLLCLLFYNCALKQKSPPKTAKKIVGGVKDILKTKPPATTKVVTTTLPPKKKPTTTASKRQLVNPGGVKDLLAITTVPVKTKPPATTTAITTTPLPKSTTLTPRKKPTTTASKRQLVNPGGVKDLLAITTVPVKTKPPATTTAITTTPLPTSTPASTTASKTTEPYTTSTIAEYGLNGRANTPGQMAARAFLPALSSASADSLVTSVAPEPGGTVNEESSATTSSTVTITVDQLKDLYSVLLAGYDTRIRPLLDQENTVRVVTTFYPNNIIEFDTQEQKIEIMGYFIIQWLDEQLKWNPADYSGSNTIFIPTRDIWTPNLIIAKAHDGQNIIGDDTDIALVRSSGIMKWVPEDIYRVVCEVDIQFYPYDIQTCSLTYYVSDETTTSVKLEYVGSSSLEEYTENAEWSLLEHTTETSTIKNNNYVHLKFKLARRGEFAMFTVIAPLLMLSFLNGMVFLVPIDTGEKGSFATTIFLSYGIFVTIVIDTLPHNSLHVSYLLFYIISLLGLSVVLVFYTIIQSKIYAQIGKKKCAFAGLAKLFSPRKKENGKDKSGVDEDASGRTWSAFLV